MENGKIDLGALIPNQRNPRKISELAFEKLRKSIKRDPKFMELRPIIVDEEYTIIGGNQRYRACLELGKKTVPETWVRVATTRIDDYGQARPQPEWAIQCAKCYEAITAINVRKRSVRKMWKRQVIATS